MIYVGYVMSLQYPLISNEISLHPNLYTLL